jgi:hypothetical protein
LAGGAGGLALANAAGANMTMLASNISAAPIRNTDFPKEPMLSLPFQNPNVRVGSGVSTRIWPAGPSHA